jgi:hypothetical protein
MHIHVYCEHGEAKFWLEPQIALAQNFGLTNREVRVVQEIIEAHHNEIQNAWQRHFRN